MGWLCLYTFTEPRKAVDDTEIASQALEWAVALLSGESSGSEMPAKPADLRHGTSGLSAWAEEVEQAGETTGVLQGRAGEWAKARAAAVSRALCQLTGNLQAPGCKMDGGIWNVTCAETGSPFNSGATIHMERIHYAIYLGLLAAMSATGETPTYENDYGRADIGHSWETMLVGEGLDGWHASEAPFTPSVWRREGDAIIADTGKASRGRLVQGDGAWAAYEFKVQATIEKGSGPQLVFGISDDGISSHFLTYLTGWKTMVIVRRNEETGEDVKLDVVDFIMELGREYDLVLKVRDHSVTS